MGIMRGMRIMGKSKYSAKSRLESHASHDSHHSHCLTFKINKRTDHRLSKKGRG